jgi:hypothetical protein
MLFSALLWRLPSLFDLLVSAVDKVAESPPEPERVSGISQTATDKVTDTMAQNAVDTLHTVPLPTAFLADAMLSGRNDVGIDRIAVRVDLLATIGGGNALPHLPRGFRVPPPDRKREDLPRFVGDGKPQPCRWLFASHERPHFVEFDRVPSLRRENIFLGRRQFLYFFSSTA